MRLSLRQQSFAKLMATGQYTPTRAAREAGYSETTARVKSFAWLDKVEIQEAIEQRKAELAAAGDELNVTAEWIVQRAAAIASQDNSPSAAVSALRLLADVKGMLGGGSHELPKATVVLLEALARGMSQPKAPIAVEARMRAASTD